MSCISSAHAAGTYAGTNITSGANLNYTVNTIAQSPVASNTVVFAVDNRPNMTLTASGATPAVIPGSVNNVYTYQITNTGNAPQDFLFSVNSSGFGGEQLSGKTDTFDMTSCSVIVDKNGNGTYEPAIDTLGYVDELSPDQSRYFFVKCDTPTTVIDKDASIISITTTVASSGQMNTPGTPLTQTVGANTAGVDVVFADAAGPDDALQDGKLSLRSVYAVSAPVITVVKTNVPWCDFSNFNANPKNIPGSYVRYSIEITNASTASASAVLGKITDTIDMTNLTLDYHLAQTLSNSCTTPESGVNKSLKITCTNGTRSCTTTPVFRTAIADSDGTTFDTVSGTWTVDFASIFGTETGYTQGELKVGEKVKLEFNAIIK